MKNKQAVVDTSMGTFVIQLLPEKAPNHVAYMMKLAREGAYNGTLFHRVIRYGIIQGGDPLSKDLMRVGLLGTGGLNQLRAEFTDDDYSRGAVAGVILPNKPDSAGSQFFICVKDSNFLDRQYTAFGEVESGMEVVDKIVSQPRDGNDNPNDRIEMKIKVLEPK